MPFSADNLLLTAKKENIKVSKNWVPYVAQIPNSRPSKNQLGLPQDYFASL